MLFLFSRWMRHPHVGPTSVAPEPVDVARWAPVHRRCHLWPNMVFSVFRMVLLFRRVARANPPGVAPETWWRIVEKSLHRVFSVPSACAPYASGVAAALETGDPGSLDVTVLHRIPSLRGACVADALMAARVPRFLYTKGCLPSVLCLHSLSKTFSTLFASCPSRLSASAALSLTPSSLFP